MTEFVVILVTVGSAKEGERLARLLVDEQLAACVNRIQGIQSIYRWQGQVEQSEEELLVIKSRRDLFDRLKKRVQELHSYSVAEIIALPILDGSGPYLRWLEEELMPKTK
jgi:periplasmic divalent cation tolerance protein